MEGYSIFVKDLEALGYLPEAVINWIALMGWSYDDHTEFFSMADLIEKFSLEHLNPSPAAINFTKFDHFNGLHIRSLEIPDLARRLRPYFEKAGFEVDDERLGKIAPIIQERLSTLDEAPGLAGFFFEDKVDPAPQELVGKGLTAAQSSEVLWRCYQLLEALPEMGAAVVENPMRELVEALSLSAGQVFGILRVAVTGRKVSPPLFEGMEIIGRGKVLERIRIAAEKLDQLAASTQE
jgi:glutamyl-tRNA synthetase